MRMTVIRRAGEEDAEVVAGLLRELGYPSAAGEVRARLGETDAVLVACDGAGLVALHRIPRLAEGGSLARITALVVAEAQRGRGVARALIAAAEDTAREWGCDLLEVSSGRRDEREPAHALYRAAGFADTAERSVRYRKRL
jgi:GNAT superfamily N-acetyltransferase